MLITGILGTVDRDSSSAQWAIGGLLILFALTYQFTVGPVCYSLVAEVGSTRLRAKTVVLARNLCESLWQHGDVGSSHRQYWRCHRRGVEPLYAQQHRGTYIRTELRILANDLSVGPWAKVCICLVWSWIAWSRLGEYDSVRTNIRY
jgi:hypothetical protein